jgi:hypothetical protein
MRFWTHTAEKCALPPGPLVLEVACLAPARGVRARMYRVENPTLQETELGEFLSHRVGGVCVFGLRLTNRTPCVLLVKRKPNAPTPRGT